MVGAVMPPVQDLQRLLRLLLFGLVVSTCVTERQPKIRDETVSEGANQGSSGKLGPDLASHHGECQRDEGCFSYSMQNMESELAMESGNLMPQVHPNSSQTLEEPDIHSGELKGSEVHSEEEKVSKLSIEGEKVPEQSTADIVKEDRADTKLEVSRGFSFFGGVKTVFRRAKDRIYDNTAAVASDIVDKVHEAVREELYGFLQVVFTRIGESFLSPGKLDLSH
jgi:hypothetical protein